MQIAIGSDHRGVALKERVIQLLQTLGHAAQDQGVHDAEQSVDYPDYALAVCNQVVQGACERGILICGTGIGMCIAANKVKGIRAATCPDEITAELSRRHNNLNVLCLPADMLGRRNLDRLLQIWLETPFEEGRHARRLEKIAEIESRPC